MVSAVKTNVLQGGRLGQTFTMEDNIYEVMLQCWQVDMDERPHFNELMDVLQDGADDPHAVSILMTNLESV